MRPAACGGYHKVNELLFCASSAEPHAFEVLGVGGWGLIRMPRREVGVPLGDGGAGAIEDLATDLGLGFWD